MSERPINRYRTFQELWSTPVEVVADAGRLDLGITFYGVPPRWRPLRRRRYLRNAKASAEALFGAVREAGSKPIEP